MEKLSVFATLNTQNMMVLPDFGQFMTSKSLKIRDFWLIVENTLSKYVENW